MVAAAAILWGGWSLVLRPSGLTALEASMVVLLVLALPAPFVFRREALRDRGAARALVLLGLADVGNMVLYFAAIRRGPVAVAVLTHYLAPLLVALAAPWLGDPRSPRALLAAPFSLLGLLLLLWRPGAGIPAVTAALGAGSAVFYAAVVFAARRAGRAFRPMAVTALHAVISAAALLLLFGSDALPPPGPGALRVAGGALVCGIAASLLFYGGLSRVSAPVAGALTYLEPLSAALAGLLAFGERLGAGALAGAAAIVACGIWVALEPPPSPRTGA
jgi:drug/metabolite transporter (DMT)-like permease